MLDFNYNLILLSKLKKNNNIPRSSDFDHIYEKD